MQSLISLNTMYVAARHRSSAAPREAEFRAYHLLSMMGRHGKYAYNPAVYLAAVQVCSLLQTAGGVILLQSESRSSHESAQTTC